VSNVKQLTLSVLPTNNFRNIYRAGISLQWPRTVPTQVTDKPAIYFSWTISQLF